VIHSIFHTNHNDNNNWYSIRLYISVDTLFAQERLAKLIFSRTSSTLQHSCRPYYRSMAAKSEIIYRISTSNTEIDLYVGGRFQPRRVDLRFLAERSGYTWEITVGTALEVLDGPGSAFAALVQRGIKEKHIDAFCYLPFWCMAWLITLGPKAGLNRYGNCIQDYRYGSEDATEPVCPELERWRQETVTLLKSFSSQARIR
jgi:hypothetical protein